MNNMTQKYVLTPPLVALVAILAMLAMLFGSQIVSASERREILSYEEFGSASKNSRRAVRELLEDFKWSWANQDVDAHIKLFSKDAEWINAYARMFRGRKDLAVFLEERLFPNFDALVSKEEIGNSKLISIRHLGNKAAVIHLATDGRRGASTIPGDLARRTHIHLVAEKQKGKWLIVHTAIMDAKK